MSGTVHELRDWLLTEHWGTVDADRLTVLAEEMRGLVDAGVQGAVVELGCYRGAMALWMRAVLDGLDDVEREIHVYDSFRGLPNPGEYDSEHLRAGELVASPQDVLAAHELWGRRPPAIHPGWFQDTLPTGLPDTIAFAYLDGDYYESIRTSLRHCVPRLVVGGVLIIDDYADATVNPRAWDGLPGVKRACDDYFGHPSPIRVIAGDSDLAFGRHHRTA
ncbi:MAG: class I SAM-dependent methyltransferase [Pseudonocardia sp.]|nr:class I SAM-dependent methyltransferase [Pseudonocardia sp.]